MFLIRLECPVRDGAERGMHVGSQKGGIAPQD
jgi:hypothetical protein